MAIRPGMTVGRYRVLREVGRADFVTAYRAFDITDRTIVTLKILDPVHGDESDVGQRFQREAAAALRLGGHPHLLDVCTAGRVEGSFFVVTAFVPGMTLDQALSGPVEPVLAAKVAAAVASALDAAHGVDLLHRDVKPASILLGRDGRILLGDFGIAGLVSQAKRATQTVRVLGTPEYLAPEIATGGTPSPLSDQYALAVVCYEMLTFSRPFLDKDPLAILYAHAHTAPIAPTTLRPELPPEVDVVLLRGLAKPPQDRFPDCSSFALALSEALGVTLALVEKPSGAPLPVDELTLTDLEVGSEPRGALSPQDQALAILLERTRELARSGEHATAMRAVQTALSLLPADERLHELHGEIEKAQRLADRYDRAQQHMRAHDWLPAREILNTIYAEQPDYRDAAVLRAQVFAAVRQEWEKKERRNKEQEAAANRAESAGGDRERPRESRLSRQARIDDELGWRYEAAVNAMRDENWETAVIILEALHDRSSEYRDVGRLLRRARVALLRQNRAAEEGFGWRKLSYRPARFLRTVFLELLQSTGRVRRRVRRRGILAYEGLGGDEASSPAPPADAPAQDAGQRSPAEAAAVAAGLYTARAAAEGEAHLPDSSSPTAEAVGTLDPPAPQAPADDTPSAPDAPATERRSSGAAEF